MQRHFLYFMIFFLFKFVGWSFIYFKSLSVRYTQFEQSPIYNAHTHVFILLRSLFIYSILHVYVRFHFFMYLSYLARKLLNKRFNLYPQMDLSTFQFLELSIINFLGISSWKFEVGQPIV